MAILSIIIGLFVAFLGYIYYKQEISRFGRLVNKFPGSHSYPILGNLLELRGSSAHIFNIFRKHNELFKTSYRMWSFQFAVINVTTPEDAEVVLTSVTQIKKSLIYDFLNEWLGTGLLTGTGTKWHHRRKLLTPAFHFNILRKFALSMGEHADMLVERLKKECDKTKTNVMPLFTHTAIQIICETAMGTIVDPTNKIQQNYFKSIYEIGEMMVYRITTPWLFNNFIFNMCPIGWKHNRLVKYLHRFTLDVIQEREANFKDSDVENLDKEDDGIGKKKRLAMLDLLISAKKKGSIDDVGIREEVNTFMFAGHDTTSVGLSFALMALANNKEHQEKIVQELEEIFGDSKRPATYEDLQKMSYLELCLKESLRIFPSVPLIGRELEEDLQLTGGIVPAGASINLHIYDIHHDPRNFPDPDKFDPERFLPENCIGRHPFAYIPFSAGLRNCIGQKFAMLEMKSVVSAVLRNFVLEPVDNANTMKLKLDFVLRNDGDINIRFKPRV